MSTPEGRRRASRRGPHRQGDPSTAAGGPPPPHGERQGLLCRSRSRRTTAQGGFSSEQMHSGFSPRKHLGLSTNRQGFQPGRTLANLLLPNCYLGGRCSFSSKVLCSGPQACPQGLSVTCKALGTKSHHWMPSRKRAQKTSQSTNMGCSWLPGVNSPQPLPGIQSCCPSPS